jgi:putative hydrolase of the HAD superfamily
VINLPAVSRCGLSCGVGSVEPGMARHTPETPTTPIAGCFPQYRQAEVFARPTPEEDRLKLPRAILFDLDDTILSAYARPEAAWLSVAEQFADELSPLSTIEVADGIIACSRAFWSDPERHRIGRQRRFEARRENVAAAFGQLAAAGRPVPPTDVAHRLADRFSEYREEQMHLFPDAHEVIDALKRRAVLLALVTNGAAEAQRAKIERFELAHRFDHIQIEGEHGFGKPEERAYLHAMEALQVEPHETWMVGDNLEWEVAAPQRLGIFAIWHDPLGRRLPPGSPVKPDRIIRSLSELLD